MKVKTLKAILATMEDDDLIVLENDNGNISIQDILMVRFMVEIKRSSYSKIAETTNILRALNISFETWDEKSLGMQTIIINSLYEDWKDKQIEGGWEIL